MSWRLVTRPIQGQQADILAASRREIGDAEAEIETCFASICLSTGSVIEDAAPWSSIPATDPDPNVPYQIERDGILAPAAMVDSLTREFSFKPREGVQAPEPFIEIVVEQNLGQDTSIDAALREGAMMDDSVRAIWQRLSAMPSDMPGAPLLFAARAFECAHGPEFAEPGEYCP